ncbi:MAG: sensor histidine kinase [Bacteroidetes bacterium]|nr:sensor histidine kinase [Bacteroidota bacterium]MBS1975444.1 sensor histidine kinase [Bacteroidota bacterium]
MKKSVIILLHIGYWVLYLILVLFFIQVMRWNSSPKPAVSHILFFSGGSIFVFLPGLTGFYSFYLIIFPRFLSRKKIAALFFSGIIFSIGCALVTMFVMSVSFDTKFSLMQPVEVTFMIIFMSLLALVHGVIGLVMKGFITWFGDIKLKEDLNKKNYETELALIKSQINPHFLFNTINNIDVLIEKDARKASAYLNKLSDMMRFMLYETKAEEIPLEKELAYIEKYIELQKIRTSNPKYVNYSVQGDMYGKMIAPMIFFPFVENAFKHVENKKKQNAINIHIAMENGKIVFECKNSYDNIVQVKPGQSGLGNELIKKRLMLLYPSKHSLEVNKENLSYVVKLIISENED